MKSRYIFKKELIKSISRRSTKGSYGKLIDIVYDGIKVLNPKTGFTEPAVFTFHAYHNTAVESNDGTCLIVEKIFV